MKVIMLMASMALLATLAGCQDANSASFDQEYAADGACCQTPCDGCSQCGMECTSACPCACQEEEDACYANSEVDTWLAQQALGENIERGIVRAHTLYPYHFVENGTALNELGRRDVAVLAFYFKANPGPLNVRRGDIPRELYAARLKTVASALSAGGVNAARVTIADGLPGGDGISSESLLRILARSERVTRSGQNDNTSNIIESPSAGVAGAP